MAKMNISPLDTRSKSRSRTLPVSQPIPDRNQVVNSTGGYVWQVNDWDRLNRFLILGTEGGTYYCQETDLLKENHGAVSKCLDLDPARTIQTIVDVSVQGRAYRNEPALLAMAIAASHKNAEARKLALDNLHKVCRIGTHLYHFTDYVTKMRGLGRGLRTALADWFLEKTPDQLAYQAIKYQQRDGWSARDMLRICHAHAGSQEQEAVFRWIVGGMDAVNTKSRTVNRKVGAKAKPVVYDADLAGHLPAIISAFEEAKTASEKRLVELIVERNLPREAVPTEKLNSLAVWEALFEKMPLTAMIRNLGKMTSIGLIKPLSKAAKTVKERLGNQEYLRKSRIHPLQVLVAAKIYAQGHGDKGKLSWTPVPAVDQALDAAFYLTFGNVEPCGKPLLIGLDVSGSMGSSAAGATPLRACEVTAAMSLVHASVEDECHIFGFADSFRELGIRKGMTLVEATKRALVSNFGSTNISLLYEYALKHQLDVAGFLCMTDNEVNSGRHPALALKQYREKFNPEARSIMMGTTATGFTCNDPTDRYGMDIVGFDTSAPRVIADFMRGSTGQPVTPSVDNEV